MDKKGTDKILEHIALRIMACTIEQYDYNKLRNLYVARQLHVTPIESNAQKWLEQEIVYGNIPRRYSYNSIRIKHNRWTDVMQSVKPDELEGILKFCYDNGMEVTLAMRYFLQAFCRSMHGEPFEKYMRQIPWEVLISIHPFVILILQDMVLRKECLPFTRHVPIDILLQIYYTVYSYEWMKLNFTSDFELVNQLFFENPLIDEKHRKYMYDAYLYNVEFLKTGKLAEILAKMTPGNEYHRKLSALQKLHEGNAGEALELLQSILKKGKTKFFEEALTNFAYGVALGLCIASHPNGKEGKELLNTAEKLMKNRNIANTDECQALLLALFHYVKGKASDLYYNLQQKTCKDRMSIHLSRLFLHHYQILDKEPLDVSEATSYIVNEDSEYLLLLYSFDYDTLKDSAERLQKETGLTTSLLPKVKRMAIWELKMKELLELNKPTTSNEDKAPSLEMERVAYMVNVHNFNVQPKLQKSKDGGITWSKGRNISLKTFETSSNAYMTAQDRQVARFVKGYSYGWYGQMTYELAGIKVIAALIGCQSVFEEYTGQPIEIREEPLQLTVQPCSKGYKVRSNVDINNIDDSGYHHIEIGDREIVVIRLNAKQKKTLTLLNDVGTFPKESKQQLTQLLQDLSSTFTVMSPLLKNATDLKHVDASPLIAVQIAPMNVDSRFISESSSSQSFSISLAVKPFGSHPPYQQPGRGMEIVSTKIEGESVQTERDMAAEKRNLKAVRKLMNPFAKEETDENRWLIDTAQCLQLLDALRTAQDVAFVEWPQGVKMRVTRPMITPDKLRLKISSAGQWFEMEGDITIGDKEKMKMAELLERLRASEGNFIRLDNDEYIALSEQLRRQLDAIDKMLIGRGKQAKIAKINGLQLEGLEELGVKMKADEPFQQLMSRIKESAHMSFTVPTNIHAELRPYQVEGYKWMSRLAYWGAGACLADDMGLGKTLQAITLMQSRASQGAALVLMPTSLLHNWKQELSRFAPAMTVKILNQQGVDRQQLVKGAEAGDVVLSTYGLLVTEGELLSQRTWNTIILDEAHTIKNRDTQTSKAAMNLQADFRLIMTGTPLQNHLSEIWNLFQFANPGLLGSYQQFTDRFILPIEGNHDQERQRLLRRLLSPFLLRRTKDDVLNELPEKTEITLRVELSKEEQALYDNIRQNAIANLEEGSKSPLQTLAEITRLRQAACHPRLVNAKLKIPSSKTLAFLNLVEELGQSGHRALVFSQFTSHLSLIREALNEKGIPHLYLDGSTTPAERNRLVRQFQTGDEPLFLISLKAGGLGLNLTAADYVVHLDPWWNPAIEDQASDRAYRIGQERPVTVYRLISVGTIEEKIIRLHQNKRSMADALLQDADIFAQISAEDVIRLLRESVNNIL